MSPIDTDLAEPPPLLRSASSLTQFSPLTPGSGPTTANLDSPSSPTATSSPTMLSITASSLPYRRSMFSPKSPTSPTFWKRFSHYHHATPTSPTSTTSNTHLRVLLVDDNEVNLQVLAKALKVHMADVFHHIDMVSSGKDAIEKLQQQSYDLILMDIDMPELNGIEATSWIRHGHQQQQQQQHKHLEKHQLKTVLAQNRRTPIVAVTTNMSLEWKKAYLKVGMVSFFFFLLFILYILILISFFFFFRMAVYRNQSLHIFFDIHWHRYFCMAPIGTIPIPEVKHQAYKYPLYFHTHTHTHIPTTSPSIVYFVY
jgi:CheY-like chemotaxis protein